MFSEKYKFMKRRSQINKENLWRSSNRKLHKKSYITGVAYIFLANSKREIKLSLKVLFMMKKAFVKEVWKGGEKRNCFRNNNLVDNWHNKTNLVITFARLIKLV